jgi:hypothetical protein
VKSFIVSEDDMRKMLKRKADGSTFIPVNETLSIMHWMEMIGLRKHAQKLIEMGVKTWAQVREMKFNDEWLDRAGIMNADERSTLVEAWEKQCMALSESHLDEKPTRSKGSEDIERYDDHDEEAKIFVGSDADGDAGGCADGGAHDGDGVGDFIHTCHTRWCISPTPPTCMFKHRSSIRI